MKLQDKEDPSSRKRKRPGVSSRIADKEIIKRRQIAREEDARAVAATRGVLDIARQHYNSVPERGRQWRKTDSKIKGLRSYNNWVKSTLIQKFAPAEDQPDSRLRILDLGCGKGGDLGKWQQLPVDLYVGIDPADVSIEQARERLAQSGGRRRQQQSGPSFHGEFYVKDCFGEWLGDGQIPIIREVGIDESYGPGGAQGSRWHSGGFDVISMMFCMHYAFESEAKARQMLANIAACLKKGGRFLGVIPNSDIIRSEVERFNKKLKDPKDPPEDNKDVADKEEIEVPSWGNSIYQVRFPGKTPDVFRPPFGWKYTYKMEEAVDEVPEYVVPWEAFRALAEDSNLELQYRKPFAEVWKEEKDDKVFGPLSERMGVRGRNRGELLVNDEEMEAASFYHAFCFYKV